MITYKKNGQTTVNRIILKDHEALQREFIATLFFSPLYRRIIFALQIIFRTKIPAGFKWYEPIDRNARNNAAKDKRSELKRRETPGDAAKPTKGIQ